jgi:hypothetical protein
MTLEELVDMLREHRGEPTYINGWDKVCWHYESSSRLPIPRCYQWPCHDWEYLQACASPQMWEDAMVWLALEPEAQPEPRCVGYIEILPVKKP